MTVKLRTVADVARLTDRPGLVGVLAELLLCTELNLDEMEDRTREVIERAYGELEKVV